VERVSLWASGSRLWVGFGTAVFTIAILSSASGTRAAAPEDDLPEGEGKKILVSSCTACHDLSEVTKFRGYYDRKQWRDIVVTMMEYGAPVDEKQVDILADYLAKNLGKQ
jgi:competence protein ComEA